jgi:hypothetical protein
MDSRLVNRFNQTHIFGNDFACALQFIKAARPYDPWGPEYHALLIAAVVFYARPFSNNEREKDPQSTPRLADSLVPFKDAELKLHERILLLRKKAVAHGESAFNAVQFIPPSDEGNGERAFGTWSAPWHILSERLDLDEFERIVDEMRRQCVNHLFDIRTAGTGKASGRDP